MNIELGTDIISISRITKVVTKFGISFLERFLLPSEIFLTRKDKTELPLQMQFLHNIDSNQHDTNSLNLTTYPVLDKNHTKACMPKFFTQENIDIYADKTRHVLQEFKRNFSLNTYRIETISGFWAAKEACAKAIGTGIGEKLRFHDICIIKDQNGKPHIALHEAKWHAFNLQKIAISISHDTHTAISVCSIILK